MGEGQTPACACVIVSFIQTTHIMGIDRLVWYICVLNDIVYIYIICVCRPSNVVGSAAP